MSKPIHGKGDRNRSASKAYQESSYWSKDKAIKKAVSDATLTTDIASRLTTKKHE